jgi:hypothetical protein
MARAPVKALHGMVADQTEKNPVETIGPKIRFLFSMPGFVAFLANLVISQTPFFSENRFVRPTKVPQTAFCRVSHRMQSQ